MELEELLTRGVQDIVPKKELMEKMRKGDKLRVYLGIDPTSTRISLGNAVPLRKLRDFQNAGHEEDNAEHYPQCPTQPVIRRFSQSMPNSELSPEILV